jgi:predicted aminopeptidase
MPSAPFDRRQAPWVPLLLTLLLSGCASLDYYAQLAAGQLELLRARQPLDAVIADPASDPLLRQRLQLAREARAFASAELALPDNGSYRSYADLGRPYVVWNVFATDELSVEPRLHCFPIAGCVAYRGYHREGRARGAAALLRAEGRDVWVAGVEAYSTLGWFDDPILNGMLRRDDQRLAALIFHELAHQQLYVADDSAFNESYASFVEREGLRQWLQSRGLAPADRSLETQRDDFTRLVLETRSRLAARYAEGGPPEQLRAAKAAEFQRLRRNYRKLRDQQWGGDGRFDAWIKGPLNNARLLPFGLYDQWVPAFAELFEQSGRDWPAFHRRVAELAQLPKVERTAALRRLAEPRK